VGHGAGRCWIHPSPYVQRGQGACTSLAFREHTVEYERVEVDIEVQSAPESLDHRHAAGVAVAKASATCASSLERQQDARVDREHGATELVAPCEEIAEPMGQAQHPLAYRNMRQDAVHETRGALGHAPAPQLGQKPRPLQEKGTSRSKAQSPQRSRAKPCASMPHVRKSRNSCSTNFGNRWPSA